MLAEIFDGTINVLYMIMKDKLLLVTTNDDHRYLLNMLLTESGYLVDAPLNIEDSSSLFEKYEYKKVIVDYDSRSYKQILFCRYLELHHKFNKSIVMQALDDDDLVSKVFDQGGDIIIKPYNIEDLLLAIRR